MFISNGVYKSVKVDPALVPIAEGTVLTQNGTIASDNGSDAYGIVPQNITHLPATRLINVAIGGMVDLTDPANKGVSISDANMQALDINFVPLSDGGGVPIPQAADVGKVLTAVNSPATIVVIPEQGLTFHAGENQTYVAPLTGVNFNGLTNGQTVNFTTVIDYGQPDGTAEVEGEGTYEDGTVTWIDTQTFTTFAVTQNSITVSGSGAQWASTHAVSTKATTEAPSVSTAWRDGGGGGFSPLIVKASGECTYTPGDATTPQYWSVGIDTSVLDIGTAFYAGRPVLFQFPEFATSEPYYSTNVVHAQILLPFLDSYTVKSANEMMSYGLQRGGSFFNPTITMWYSLQPQI